MYADRDKRGKASIMELARNEELALLDALKQHKEYCDTVYELFSYREDFKEESKLLEKMIKQMERI